MCQFVIMMTVLIWTDGEDERRDRKVEGWVREEQKGYYPSHFICEGKGEIISK